MKLTIRRPLFPVVFLLGLLLCAVPASAFQQTDAKSVEADLGARTADAEITARIEAIFENYDRFSNITVEVDAGVVTLHGTVLETEWIREAEALTAKTEGVVAVRNLVDLDTSVSRRLKPALERLDDRFTETVAFVPLMAVGMTIFLLILLFGFFVTRFEWPFSKLAPNAFIENLLRQFIRILFSIVAVVVSLDVMGATALLGTILGAAGIIGLAIGFAVQDTIENYIASIMLSLRQPFRPNDLVKIDDFEGRVMRLTSRATILMTQEGNHIRIPNARVFKGVIVNYTRSPERRFHFTLGINADADIQKAIQLGLQALETLGFVLQDPPPVVRVEEVGDSSIVIWFGGWIDQRETNFFAARGEAIRVTKNAMEAGGLELPEPIYRLKLEGAVPDGTPPSGASSAPPFEPPFELKATPATEAPAQSANDPQVISQLSHAVGEDPVEERVEAARKRKNHDDLLNENAAQE